VTRRTLLFSLGILTFAAPVAVAVRRRRTKTAMVDAATAFLASLTPDQRARTTFALNDAERLSWHYVPTARKGLTLKEMTPAQQAAALRLLRAGLSERGYSKAETIRQLELVLKAMENGNPGRDPENYHFSVFGTPSETGAWGWRYEGHHCSQNWTVVSGRGIASTPQFFGANPAEVRQGPMKGTRVLAAEEDLARTLVHSLDDTQRTLAVVSPTAPPDMVTGAQRQVAIEEAQGIPYARLTKDQQGMLVALIEEYASAQPAELARERLDRIRRSGLDPIAFSWMGGIDRGQPHYYRIQGPTFLIEYDNTQDNANHIHSVWRDYKDDFGQDLLAQHYATASDGHGHHSV